MYVYSFNSTFAGCPVPASCLCGGRFGNQFDSMLGFMDFAKKIDRTARLPPTIPSRCDIVVLLSPPLLV